MESILVALVLAVIGLVAAIGIYWGVSDPVGKAMFGMMGVFAVTGLFLTGRMMRRQINPSRSS